MTVPQDPAQEFPDPLTFENGERVRTAADWSRRRAEIQASLLAWEYGPLPPVSGPLEAMPISSEPVAGGQAVPERLQCTYGPHSEVVFTVDLHIPPGKTGPFPVLVTGDRCWGGAPIREEIAARGYLLAEFDRTEIAQDGPDRENGVFRLDPAWEGGVLAAWAWGYQRVIDILLTRDDVDAARIAITGHSRGGKAALLAGALDTRVALTAPNGSGCGGAGSFRLAGEGSESLTAILDRFPYWFSPRLREFAGQEERLPFDQHFLLALVAPRALLITSATGDLWANPAGTELTYRAAKTVFEFLGAADRIGSHYREGGHAQDATDWRALLDFAEAQFFEMPLPGRFNRPLG